MNAERPVEPTELVAGAWQLRPWPAAYADLDELLAERYPVDRRPAERERRVEGWSRGTHLGFAVRDITTGGSIAEVAVVVPEPLRARVETWVRPGQDATGMASAVDDVVRRWATGALGLTLR